MKKKLQEKYLEKAEYCAKVHSAEFYADSGDGRSIGVCIQ
jgi:hypothetical protein